MCFSICNIQKMDSIIAKFDAVLGDSAKSWEPSAVINGFARPEHPLLCSDEPSTIKMARWGLIPHWAKDEKKAKDISLKTLNARAETMKEKPSFRGSVNRRCLIPVSGFFEPHHRGKNSIPFLFTRPDGDLFALAGLYSESSFTAPPHSRNFSIITIDADRETAQIHNQKKRMPLIIPEEGWSSWLNRNESIDQWQVWAEKPRNLIYWSVSNAIYSRSNTYGGTGILSPVLHPFSLEFKGELF